MYAKKRYSSEDLKILNSHIRSLPKDVNVPTSILRREVVKYLLNPYVPNFQNNLTYFDIIDLTSNKIIGPNYPTGLIINLGEGTFLLGNKIVTPGTVVTLENWTQPLNATVLSGSTRIIYFHSGTTFRYIPRDILQIIGQDLDIRSLRRLCQTSPQLNRVICNNLDTLRYLWQQNISKLRLPLINTLSNYQKSYYEAFSRLDPTLDNLVYASERGYEILLAKLLSLPRLQLEDQALINRYILMFSAIGGHEDLVQQYLNRVVIDDKFLQELALNVNRDKDKNPKLNVNILRTILSRNTTEYVADDNFTVFMLGIIYELGDTPTLKFITDKFGVNIFRYDESMLANIGSAEMIRYVIDLLQDALIDDELKQVIYQNIFNAAIHINALTLAEILLRDFVIIDEGVKLNFYSVAKGEALQRFSGYFNLVGTEEELEAVVNGNNINLVKDLLTQHPYLRNVEILNNTMTLTHTREMVLTLLDFGADLTNPKVIGHVLSVAPSLIGQSMIRQNSLLWKSEPLLIGELIRKDPDIFKSAINKIGILNIPPEVIGHGFDTAISDPELRIDNFKYILSLYPLQVQELRDYLHDLINIKIANNIPVNPVIQDYVYYRLSVI